MSRAADAFLAEYPPRTPGGVGYTTEGRDSLICLKASYLVFLRPFMDLALFHKIAESAPVKLAKGHGTLEFDFMLTDTDHLPISPARSLVYLDLLP